MRQVGHLTNYKTMLRILDDLKYLHRLNKQEFWDLVFPNSLEHYFEPKWSLFQKDKLSFLWSCQRIDEEVAPADDGTPFERVVEWKRCPTCGSGMKIWHTPFPKVIHEEE